MNGNEIALARERNRALAEAVRGIIQGQSPMTMVEILRAVEARGLGKLLPADDPSRRWGRNQAVWRALLAIGAATITTTEEVVTRRPVTRYFVPEDGP